MKEAGGVVLLALMAERAAEVTPFAWSGWFISMALAVFIVYLLYSSRVENIRKQGSKITALEREVKKLLTALADEKQRVIELTNRNDELKTQMNTLHGEYVELRGQFSQLNVAYSKLGDQVDKLREDLKAEREKRDEQFAQWIKEKAQNGDL